MGHKVTAVPFFIYPKNVDNKGEMYFDSRLQVFYKLDEDMYDINLSSSHSRDYLPPNMFTQYILPIKRFELI